MEKQIRQLRLGYVIGAIGLLLGQVSVGLAQTVAPTWTLTGNLHGPRIEHTATRLLDGKVLIAGGAFNGINNSAEIYDPSTGTWSVTGNMNMRRIRHSATLLRNGKVLITGGFDTFPGEVGSLPVTATNATELYDPATGTWSLTGNMNWPRAWHTATMLQNGKVLVVGGQTLGGYVFWNTPLNTAELYDPESGTWSVTGNLTTGQGHAAHTATLLENGKVLVVGGTDQFYDPFTVDEEYGGGLASAELYDPSTGSWTVTGAINSGRMAHTATLLPNGHVLIAGGGGSPIGLLIDMPHTAEKFNPTSETWSFAGQLRGRAYHTATLLPNGRVLVTGGLVYEATLNDADIYDPIANIWSSTVSSSTPRSFHTATLLLSGKVLVAGGDNGCCYTLSSSELYNSASFSEGNPIDDPSFFVRQHYIDFLNREPEAEGFEAWLRFMNDCPSSDVQCFHQKRLITSAGFYGSPEFQLKGYFVFRFYRVAFGRLPAFEEITPDMQSVTDQTPEAVFTRKAAFVNSFVQRQEFVNTYSALSNTAFVSSLLGRYQLDRITTPDPANPNGNVKVLLTESDLVLGLNTGTLTRGQVLRAIADSDEVFSAEFNRAFVAMQYYGYLRRTPEPAGYQDWLNYLNAHPADFLEMVRGFVDSVEYRARFGQP